MIKLLEIIVKNKTKLILINIKAIENPLNVIT